MQSVALSVSLVTALPEPTELQPIITDRTAFSVLLDSPPDTRQGIRDRTILCTLCDGALRADELVKLKYGEVNFDDEVVSLAIHGRDRTVCLSPELIPHLVQFRTLYHSPSEAGRPFFCTTVDGIKKNMTTRNLELIVRKYSNQTRETLAVQYGDKAELMLPSKITPHTLRRTRATLLLRDGAPSEQISAFPGHAGIEVTRRHCAVPSDEQLIELARKGSDVIPDDENGDTPEKLRGDDMDDPDKIFNF